MPSIQQAYTWAVETCGKENVGYSQDYRNQRTINGITYYDCSSFIWYSLIAGGFPCVATNGGDTWPFTTRSMERVLSAMGFKKHQPTEPWLPGDILMKSGHTEMAFDATRSMGAHTARVPLAEQVSVNTNDSRNNGWYALWRWETGAAFDWIKGNRYLALGEMQNNATIIVSYFLEKGWTKNAISGVLGNMQTESTINPGLWQNLTVGTGGFGLVQWTPATKFTDWADAHAFEHDDGNAQLQWIDEETAPTGEWIPTSKYPLSFEEFKRSTESPSYLADAYLKNFERPKVIDQPIRLEQAEWWMKWIDGEYVPPPNPPSSGGDWEADEEKTKMWLYLRNINNI